MNLVIWHFDPVHEFPTVPGVYKVALPRLGHRVTWVISTEGDGHQTLVREENGVRVIEIQRPRDTQLPRPFGVLVNRLHKLRRFFAKARWMSRLAAERPDVIQVRDSITDGYLALFFARRHHVRFAFQWDFQNFEARINLCRLSGWRRRLFTARMRLMIALRALLMRRASLVLPISEGQGAITRDRHGVDPARIVPLPVGVTSDWGRRAEERAPHPMAAELRDCPALCYLGTLNEMRDPEFAFKVFSAVLEEMPEARILFVGKMIPLVERLRAESPARERILCTGFIPHEDVPATLKAARMGVFPISLSEGFDIYRNSSPLKVVEYMASGLPVVSSRVEDAEWLLGESGGGVCVENDADAFARATVAYLRDPARARADGEKGRAYVERHRTFDVLARDIEAAYERLMATGVPAPLQRRLPRPGGTDALPARREV